MEFGRYFSFVRGERAIAELDGLRAAAVLLVLARHAVWPLYDKHGFLYPVGAWDWAVPLLNGWIGVDLFFVLSGFLITYHLLRRGAHDPLANVGRYLGARALRIVPAYVAVLGIVVAGLIPLYQVAPEYMALRVTYHLLFLQDYLPANIVVAFWSLGVEEKFYLLAPLLVWAALRTATLRRRYALLLGLLLLPLLLRTITALQHPELTDYAAFFRTFRSPFHNTLDGLAIGVLCAFLYADRVRLGWSAQARWPARLFWIGVALLLWQLFARELLGAIGWHTKTLQPLAISLTFGALVLAAIFDGAPGVLRARSLLIVARISYPLYLIHMPLVPLALAWSGFEVGDGPLAFLGYVALFFGISILAALAVHFTVEKPFLILKDRLWPYRPLTAAAAGALPAPSLKS